MVKKRSISYCQMVVLRNGIDQRDTTSFKEALKSIKKLGDSERTKDFESNDKVVGIESIDTDHEGYVWIVFKTGRYGHTANLINRYDGSERPSNKRLDEGEKELTHACLKVLPEVIYCAIESNKYGISAPLICNYLESFVSRTDSHYALKYDFISTRGLSDIIINSQRIMTVDVECSYINSNEDISRQLYGPGVKQTYIQHFSVEKKESFSRDKVHKLYNSVDPNGKIRRVKITLRSEDGDEMLLDSLMEKVRDKIPVNFDSNGTVVSSDILEKLQSYLLKLEDTSYESKGNNISIRSFYAKVRLVQCCYHSFDTNISIGISCLFWFYSRFCIIFDWHHPYNIINYYGIFGDDNNCFIVK